MSKYALFITVLITLLLSTSCVSVPNKYSVSGKLSLENNTFEYSYEDDTTINTAKIRVVYSKKEYTCEVIYEKGAHSPFGIAFDASTVELTGSIKVIYKKVIAECKVGNN